MRQTSKKVSHNADQGPTDKGKRKQKANNRQASNFPNSLQSNKIRRIVKQIKLTG